MEAYRSQKQPTNFSEEAKAKEARLNRRVATVRLPGGRCRAAERQVVQKLRGRGDAGNQQVIPRPGAGHIQQVALGVVNLLKIGVVGDGFDALLARNHFIVDVTLRAVVLP